jgi:hypothetical protein
VFGLPGHVAQVIDAKDIGLGFHQPVIHGDYCGLRKI